MVKHNNVVPFQHFHKKWARRVKTWFHQPAQKRIRRENRKVKAAQLAPRPASGALRPQVRGQTQRYNKKVRAGRGFTLEELKTAGVQPKYAQTVGIAVDHRRVNKSNESLDLNVQRLKEYLSRLVVIPRKSKTDVPQLTGDIVAPAAKDSAHSFITLTEEMKEQKAYATLRGARSDARLVGIRQKQKLAKEEKKDE